MFSNEKMFATAEETFGLEWTFVSIKQPLHNTRAHALFTPSIRTLKEENSNVEAFF